MPTTPFNWKCPFCGHNATITNERYSSNSHTFSKENKYGPQTVRTLVTICPNPDCLEYTLQAALYDRHLVGSYWGDTKNPKQQWSLIPAASIEAFPDYVPQVIRDDYREACLVRNASPKASATLSRRCLQGMIRDFWNVSGSTLFEEINKIEEEVDPTTWDAIHAVRSIGNIGAHMEKDINLIVDVEPEEADLLIELIETLIKEWYVARHKREQRMARIVAASEQKKAIKKNKALPAPPSDADAA